MSYNNKLDFNDYLTKRSNEITEHLKKTVKQTVVDSPEIIIDAVNYSLFAEGKRIRPLLTIEAGQLVTGQEDLKIIPLAEAVEMIHTYSLIHDDLPALDNAEYRRGKKTNHLVYGEDTAILAGDSLLNMAMECALNGVPLTEQQETLNYLAALKFLFNSSGVNGMIGGQVADTVIQAKGSAQDNIEYIESHKTGALISAAILCGSIPYLGVNDKAIKILYNYSRLIGQIFQIVDDILDETSDRKTLGKDVGIDARNDTRSYLAEHSLEQAWSKVEELREQAYQELNKLEDLPGSLDFWYKLTDYLCKRTK